MTFEEKEKLVQKFLQGDLSQRQEQKISEQIGADPVLQKLVKEHSDLISHLSSIDAATMPDDLWKRKLRPAIAGQLSTRDTSAGFWRKLSDIAFAPRFRPAFAGVGFVLIMVVSTVMLQSVFFTSEPEPYDVALAKIEELRAQYHEQLQVLIVEMDSRKDLLLPEVQLLYEDLMIMIDDNIAQSERVYAIYSSDDQAVRMLMEAYDEKAKTIQDFMNMTL